MTRGLSPEAEAHRPAQPPLDRGEALGVPPCRLTVTFGLGPDVFHPRLGLAAARPRRLEPLPAMPGDALSAARCGGDLMIQACAEDAMVSYHAIRHLVRLASGTARVRWLQQGFGATATTTPAPQTPRNLFGLKDGTDSPTTADPFFAETVWVANDDGPAWLTGGSYLGVRRIRMHLERATTTPAPQTPRNLFGLLRRGYSFDDGWDAVAGTADAGLFFLAYGRDLAGQLVPLLRRLASHDGLNEYVTHTTSAVFAVLPGASPGGLGRRDVILIKHRRPLATNGQCSYAIGGSCSPRSESVALRQVSPMSCEITTAEGVGFEPTVEVAPDSGFQDRRARPLREPSSDRTLRDGSPTEQGGNPGPHRMGS